VSRSPEWGDLQRRDLEEALSNLSHSQSGMFFNESVFAVGLAATAKAFSEECATA